ncbi:MAG: ABC transporter substrate-binding protein [Cryobacterium sp.]|uniref:ABC transporter substrate-binding protein n=1 Tax=unclassified Cryobacterium TaxID=2649013 RepID=UPI0018CB811A|nr:MULTISPECIES: ABC transporter substrate-binding protein [unclassified Cryobacterium]MCY7404622.1 ABC transporter substrate-binding protein [Cryobacterium sp.]MEC5153824.1 putative ABC transport system substrate-binding protein [Cryobacterium sp. CAN_C3]
MKHTTSLSALALVTASTFALSGCAASEPTASASDDMITIGISQIVQHQALDDAREGFKKAFVDGGYVEGTDITFDEQNAQGEQATASTIAAKFAADKVDLVLAIATPTAQAAAQTIIDIPLLFTAVTEPEEAGLVESWEKPGSNVTGTSDLNPVKEQLELIQEILPDAKSVGVIYSSGEVNSDVQVDLAKEAAKTLGLTIKEATVTNSSEVAQATESLGNVDAIYIPTDNRVTEGLEAVIQYSEANRIPLFGAENGQVERGAIATYGINYTDLGYQTGQMAIRILKDGEKPADMPVETLDTIEFILNPAAAKRMGVTLSDELIAKADRLID